MTIPKITPYSGGVANPDGSQTQTEFTQNMFDQLSYEAELSNELNNTVDGINDTAIQVDADSTSASQSAAAAEAAASGLNYQGLWPDTGGIADKGDTYQTQVSGAPTGLYFTALQNTTADPVGDDVNWRIVVSVETLGLYSDLIADSTSVFSLLNFGEGYVISTRGYYEKGDGGSDTYTTYNPLTYIVSYQTTAQQMLDDNCAGVFLLQSGSIAVRNYNTNIDVRQVGFKPCSVTFVSDRIGWTPDVGSFDNASLFQKYDALINKMQGHETTFSGHFAVGFTGYSNVVGNENTCCRYSSKRGKLIGTVSPALIALPFADAMVIRTPTSNDPDYSGKIEYLELENFLVCGNWSEQTWAGPTGLEDLADNPLSGWVSGKKIYDQNGFGTYAIERLITRNSGAMYCAQDGMPSGGVEYAHHTNMHNQWTGKGCNSNFNFRNLVYIDPEHNYSNESPDDSKPIYTLSSDGYSAVGTQNIDETNGNTEGVIHIVRPKGEVNNGRWGLFSVIQGTINPDVYIYDADGVESTYRNIFSTAFKANAGGSITIDGGSFGKDGNGRSASIVNCDVVKFKNKPKLTVSNSDDGRIDVSGTTSLVEGSFEESGVAAQSILMTDVSEINLHDLNCRLVGMINCGDALIRDSKIDEELGLSGVTNWSFYNNRGSDHPEKRPNELIGSILKSGVSVPASGTTDIVITIPGAEVGDFVDAVAAPSANTEQFTTSESRVTASNTVTIRLFNVTASPITLGSQTWSVVVRKRNVII